MLHSGPTSGSVVDRRAVGDLLRGEINRRAEAVRPAAAVMQPAMLGAARLTRYSFSRMMLRSAIASGWRATRVRFDIDADGNGEAIYEIDTGVRTFSFVAFTTSIDEAEHTDRVVARDWEITSGLVDGTISDSQLPDLRAQIPLQERGRLDPRVLVLGRGNRSVRFFGYLVDCLAAGQQPDASRVGDAAYIMRSTAFYANGKFGMRSFDGYPDGHELAVPYRAQFVAAWMFRELSYDVVEHCAAERGGDAAVGFDEDWRRYFGIGNATGLGLVPYAFKHPTVINSWVAIRELALADVRLLPATPELVALLGQWVDRALAHFRTGTNDDCAPFLNAASLVGVMERISAAFDRERDQPDVFDRLYLWAEAQDAETTECVVSLLIELHEGDDRKVDEMLLVDESTSFDPAMPVDQLRALLSERFAWIDTLPSVGTDATDRTWWVISDNTDEPRRVSYGALAPAGRDVTIDVAARIFRLRADLDDLGGQGASMTASEFLSDHPQHRLAVERVQTSTDPYGEPRDDACAASFLPLQLQRFQLAMYGMDNFKPKSTDWLRVTLFQGAPRIADLALAPPDNWVLPPQPRSFIS